MLALNIATEQWPLKEPFRITNYVFTDTTTLTVTLHDGKAIGRGEACGVYYRNDDPRSMAAQIESVRGAIEAGINRTTLQTLLPPGGARNALDCALWDLEARRSGIPVWQLADLPKPHALTTTFTISAGTPRQMADAAKAYKGAKALKLKLTGPGDALCVRAVREARPDAWIGVDANQGLTRKSLEALLPEFKAWNVGLIEQPVPVGADAELDGLKSPIPIAADESVQTASDIKSLIGRYDVLNIKLDKSGGLTEGLLMARMAQRLGLKVMVGCMAGTSLAMAPAFLLGQLCDVVDLDAPLFLAKDRKPGIAYGDGEMTSPEALWGWPT